MEPLLVIKKRGDYYKLIRYSPEILNNQRLTNRKEAEYCGWIHKDRLLLFDNAITEIRNGIKLKNLTAIQESRIITDADKFFKNDSLILYTQPKLEIPAKTLMELNQIVYVLKMTDDDTKALISYSPVINPDNLSSSIIGWVDASLTVPFGQRLTLSRAPELTSGFYDLITGRNLMYPAVSPVE